MNNSLKKNLHSTRIKYLLSKLKYWQKLIITENKPESKFLKQTEIYHTILNNFKNLNHEIKFLQLIMF